MNISICSLSLLSIYSFSPLYTNNAVTFSRSSLKNFFQIIFFNPSSIQLDKSKFSNGIGSILYTSPSKISENLVTSEYQDIVYVGSNYSKIYPPSESSLIIIRDCQFINIYLVNSHLIETTQNYQTFYMTSCIFNSIGVKETMIYAFTRATKITHICFSSITRLSGGNQYTLLLFFDFPGESFVEFVYSSITESANYMGTNKRYSLFLLSSDPYTKGSIRIQCINSTNSNSSSVVDVISANCLTMQMNTFSALQSSACFLLESAQSGEIAYCGMTNFFNCKFSDCILMLQASTTTNVVFDNCVFSNLEIDTEGNFVSGGNAVVSNCVLDKEVNWYVSSINCVVVNNPTMLKLAHFSTENACPGESNVVAYGCHNGTCPDSNGCDVDAFDFKENDVTYTEKVHYGYNAVPTSNYFTVSSLFSKSDCFSASVHFTQSEKFTFSDSFTPTKSSEFTKSALFTISDPFTESNSFLPTPTQSLYSHAISILKSISFSYVNVRSVTLMNSNHIGKTFIITHIDGSHFVYQTETIIETQIYYIIYTLSPTYIHVSTSIEIIHRKNKITSEMLIGIVCGSVATFFIILAFVILIIRRNEIRDISSEIDDSSENKEISVIHNSNVNLNSMQNKEFDNWL